MLTDNMLVCQYSHGWAQEGCLYMSNKVKILSTSMLTATC